MIYWGRQLVLRDKMRIKPHFWPNFFTGARLVLALIIFSLLFFGKRFEDFAARGIWQPVRTYWAIVLWLFLVAWATDLLDGLAARMARVESAWGRVADPLVDKILICGIFIFLLPLNAAVSVWMVAIILGREILVSVLRSIAERRGVSFEATPLGKIKMTSQFLTLGFIILFKGSFPEKFMDGNSSFILFLLYLTIAITLASGITYVWKFIKVFPHPPARESEKN
jgi:CDP-diacylglycerol--glycerol-3-phosphate 3-phosphatidyltransferase